MKRICLLLAVLCMAACQTNVKNTSEALDPRTEIIGELDKGCLGDSVRIMLMDGIHENEIHSYPIFDEIFAIPLKTDLMTLCSVLITYDGGASTDYFIPEGGKIYVKMNRRGGIRVSTDKKNSLTEYYGKMCKDISDLKWSSIHRADSIATAKGYSEEQKDSMMAIVGTKVDEFFKKQAVAAIKDPLTSNNIIGLTALMNLQGMMDLEELKALYKGMGPAVQSHPAIPDSLKN